MTQSSHPELLLALPSKGRLFEAAEQLFTKAGFELSRSRGERGYHGLLQGTVSFKLIFLAADEIARHLCTGRFDMGITGADLLYESYGEHISKIDLLLSLGFGAADLVVAVPEAWLDVATIIDLDEVAQSFYKNHGRRLRVASKYPILTRRFFAEKGISAYRLLISQGATEAAPAVGMAEIISDITTSGATLCANSLKILDDGIILRSCAVLAGAVDKNLQHDRRVQSLIRALSAVLHEDRRDTGLLDETTNDL